MVFEKLFEKVGERIDKTFEDIGKKVNKTSEDIKKRMEKTREEVSDEFIKKVNKLGEKLSVNQKDLSNFERAAANIAIGVAHSLEEGYKAISKKLFLTEKERKTQYGTLGKVWSEKYVPRERGVASLEYAKRIDQKLEFPLKKEMLKDIVESLSSSNSELYGFYIYHHFTGQKRSKDHDEKKKIVKERLMSKEERMFYDENKKQKESPKK